MANTTNYNWETPDDTDLVKDGAAAIRTLGSSVDTTTKALNPSTTLGDIEYRSATANTNTRLGIGSTGQVLTVAGGVPTWATSDDANAIQNAIVDAKGDIVAASAADTPARLAVGTDNQRLVAASGETTGLKYVADTQNTVIDAEGDLLVGDSADTLQRLAIGSNTHVLTVDTSVDGKIKWAAPAGGGGMTSLASGSIAASATGFDLTSISGAYNELWLYLSDISVDATGVGYGIDLKINNDTGNNYASTGTGSAGVLSYSAVNEWKLAVQEDASNDHSILLRIPNYANTTSTKIGQWVSHDYYAGAAYPRALSGVWTATPAAIDRLTLVIDVGAFDGGTYNLYGVK